MAKEIAVACRNGDLERVKDLVEQQHVDPNELIEDDGKTPLHWAAHFDRLEVMKYLVEECKCDPMCRDVMWENTPLHWAARYASLEVVKYLVEDCNCEVMCRNNRNNTPLHDAALGGQLEVVTFLTSKKNCDPGVLGQWGRTPLHYACEGGNIAVVKFLLETSGYKDSSCQDEARVTPLHIAASQGSSSIVRYLIEEQNCEKECKNHHGDTPLHEAIKGGRFEVMKYLINRGCDPKWRGKSGGTALHHACQHGRVEEVKYLIAGNNLAIDSPCDNSGASPLHVAAVNGRLDVVKLLVETFLCKLDVRDSNGQTPLERAQDKQEEDIVLYLQDFNENSSNLRTTLLKQLRPKTKQVIPTGTVLGSGAYGSVIELTCEEKIVAGKIFRTMSTAHKIAVQESIKDELNVMMKVDHPNIVQTMGVCFLPDEPLPVLLMERMECNLHSYILDPNHLSCPMETKLSILCDIANGLAHLHDHRPPIIHRDLTANNVLLDLRPRAKIADFGNSQILNSHSMILGTFTSLQQSCEYNPFEGYEEFSPSLDVFQFGHLALFTTIQAPVRPLLPPNYTDKRTGELRACSEVERRQQFVEKAEQLLSRNHSLVELIKQCLHNDPEERPCTRKLMTRLEEMVSPVKSEPDVDLAPGVDRKDDAVRKRLTVEKTHYLRGVDVIAETSVQINNQAQSFHWAGYGLKLHIPQKALPAGLEKCRIIIKVGISGQFVLPQDTTLVSAVYWLDSEPRCKFSQPFTLEIQHCAMSSQTSSLSFSKAKCSQRNLPYTFKILEGGGFSTLSAYGSVHLHSFSLITLVKRLILGDDNVRYRASTYYLRKGMNQKEIHFVITKDQEAYVTDVQQKYNSKRATTGPDIRVKFESETISLQLPSEEEMLGGGWRIIPLFAPMITKEDVDGYRTGQGIPSCQLTAEWTKQSKPSRFIHKVTLEGAKKPFNYLCIVLDCDIISPTGAHYSTGLYSEPELPDLMNEVAAIIPGKWRDVAIQLGLEQGLLDGIAIISPGNTNHCYSNVFTRWKNQNSEAHPYIWLTVVRALESQAVGEQRLADKLRNELTGRPLQ